MNIYHDLSHCPSFSDSIGLTFGTYDGIHCGHQAVISTLKNFSKHSIVITFRNHPLEVISPSYAPSFLCSLEQRLSLLERYGVDTCIIIPFSQRLSQLCAEDFLVMIRNHIPFTHLVLGYDALFGRNHDGVPEHVARLGSMHGFNVNYVSQVTINGAPVSSSRTRRGVSEGDLINVNRFLGRGYSLCGLVSPGRKIGTTIGYPTANLDLSKLENSTVLPPLGVYSITGAVRGKQIPGIANIGHAPTVKDNRTPILEAHFFDDTLDNLYGEHIEIIFHKFIRPEKKFSSTTELSKQIENDIKICQTLSNCSESLLESSTSTSSSPATR